MHSFFDNKYVSSLTIKENESLTFLEDSLFIGTFIMEDSSQLKFVQDVYLYIENAHFGKNVEILNIGKQGKHFFSSTSNDFYGGDGFTGSKGYDIYMIVSIQRLGSLIISTNGGNEKPGISATIYNASPMPEDGGNGEDGGRGGEGGNAGDITFFHLEWDLSSV